MTLESYAALMLSDEAVTLHAAAVAYVVVAVADYIERRR